MALWTVSIDLKWYCFTQNNAGGEFVVNENVAHYVLVQDRSAKYAIERAREFCEAESCECCGDRWNLSYIEDKDGTDDPEIYNKPLENYSCDWIQKEARLHYFEGCVKPIVLPRGA